MEPQDIEGNVLIIPPCGCVIESMLIAPMRVMMYRRFNAPVPKSSSSSSSVFNFLWYPDRMSELREYRTVLVRLACLSKAYEGSAEGISKLPLDSPRLARIHTAFRTATVVVFVYTSDSPESLAEVSAWSAAVAAVRGGTPFSKLLLGVKLRNNSARMNEARVKDALASPELIGARHCVMDVPEPSEMDLDRFHYECVLLISMAHKARRGETLYTEARCRDTCDITVPHKHYATESEFWGSTECILFQDPSPSITMPKEALFHTHLRAPVPPRRRRGESMERTVPPLLPQPPPPVLLPANSVSVPGKTFTEKDRLLFRKK